MSNTPNDPELPGMPPSPPPPPSDPKGPWIYSGGTQPTGGYYSNPAPVAAGGVRPAEMPRPMTAAVAAPAVPQAARPAPAKESDASLASIIDTIEAIIIALIIALTFRAFIVEAFVIPTGSMAPTLLGAHFKVICPSCGYGFDRNASLGRQYKQLRPGVWGIPEADDRRAELVSNMTVPADEYSPIYCPNCMYPISPTQLPQYLPAPVMPDNKPKFMYDGRRLAERKVEFAWANNGDRILVLKYLYALMEPSRFDVIVFKEPQEAKDNYIKRLVGLPGETLEIVNGDLYAAPPGKLDDADRVITRKPERLQTALWQVVYDNDYYPSDEGRARPAIPDVMGAAVNTAWVNPWQALSDAEHWTRGTTMQYSGTGPNGLQFGVRGPYTQNVLGYNDDFFPALDPMDRGPRFYADDLRVETQWTPTAENAAGIALTLGRTNNRFRLRWNKDGIALEKFDPQGGTFDRVTLATPATPPALQFGKSYAIAVNNVDRAIQVYIDGAKVLTHETPWTVLDARRESANASNNPADTVIRIDVDGPCRLSHLKLFRDLYYTQTDGLRTANEGHPLTLGPDEFFALGDNSRKSLDGRWWNTVFPAMDDAGTRPGIVPRRYLLGKAFFVYWPAGYRITANDNVPVLSGLPLVPDTGDMRMIR